jgi:ATP-dependent phosphoenolpyruvate carboxykinase
MARSGVENLIVDLTTGEAAELLFNLGATLGQTASDQRLGSQHSGLHEAIDSTLHDRRSTRNATEAYDAAARKLVTLFTDNSARFEEFVDLSTHQAAPTVRAYA